MSINSTLIGQAITFAIFVWFTMKFVWPMILSAMDEREQKIADGLAAAERGHHELHRAHEQAKEELNKAKLQAADIIEKATKRADIIVSEAETSAKEKYNKIIDSAQVEIKNKEIKLKEELKSQVVDIAVLGAERILRKNIDSKAQNDLISDLVERL